MSLSSSQIRDKFISYFRDKRGHLHLPSSSLIPDNPTLLLTSAGMVQFVPIFLGQSPPPQPPRAVTAQKCARAGGKDSDIENVGRTARHNSFFEMLGNFSFGDYFKTQVIPWAWEFLTVDLGLEPEKLSVTIFGGDADLNADDEAYAIWRKQVGVPKERIIRMPRKDNFWGPPGPTGPCGPCSEIYYDRGEKYGCNGDPNICGIGKCECDRYLEFWNLVFMEFFKDEKGSFVPLAQKNVDTGLGLDRITLILQEKENVYETDLLFPLVEEASRLSGKAYKNGCQNEGSDSDSRQNDTFLKIIADHTRCVTFLVSDGVRMSNIGRGYVLRFITRRAARFGRLLGITEPFIYKLVAKVVSVYGSYYTELAGNQQLIERIILEEEERFAKTIDRGTTLLETLLKESNEKLDGAATFNLYSTFGFPVELTQEIAQEHSKTIDMDGFALAKKEHEEASSVGKFNINIAGDEHLNKISKLHGGTKFNGYNQSEGSGEVIAILRDGKIVDHLEEGDEAEVILNETPFYAESGGQLGDIGKLSSDDSQLTVLDTKKSDKLHIHKVRVAAGTLEVGQKLQAAIDKQRRQSTVLHHSSAHIFHAAIRKLFGKQVTQAGSQVGPTAMRFDFTLDRQPTAQELAQVESMMNDWIRTNTVVKTEELPIEEAKRTGAIAMFGEKYGDVVRVVHMGDFSLEFCGGTHISNTSEIGLIKIISEGSIASGVRRIELVSGPTAMQYISKQMDFLNNATKRLKTRPEDLADQIEKLQQTLKEKDRLAQELKAQLALTRVPQILESATRIGDLQFIASEMNDLSVDDLKSMAESIRSRPGAYVIVLASVEDKNKVSLVAAVSDELIKRGIKADSIIKQAAPIIAGSGGGRPQVAQAGGKEPAKIKEAFAAIKESLSSIGKAEGAPISHK